MPQKLKKEFCVLQFLERPYVYLDEFVYVPKIDILARNVINNVVFTYPINPSMRNRIFYEQWPLFLGDYKCTADSPQKAKDICRELVIQQRRNGDTDLNDTDDPHDDSGKYSRRKSTEQKANKRTEMKASKHSQKDIGTKVLDDKNMLRPEFMKTLTKELESYEKQQTELDEARELILKKSRLLKEFIAKLKYYNEQEDTNDDKYQKLIEIIKDKERQIRELKLQVKANKAADVSTNKTASDTQWTLRYHAESYGIFELLDDSGLFVNGVAACYILRYAQTRTELARMLLSEVFTEKALRTCNFNSLDLNARIKLVNTAESIYRPSGNLGMVSKDNIIRALKNRLYAINRIPG